MGALTENRKRRYVDLFPSPPINKKLKFLLPPTPKPFSIEKLFPRTPSAASGEETVSRLRRFPPAQPLSRPLHGPQRVLRFFGLGKSSSGNFWKHERGRQNGAEEYEMGGLFSRAVGYWRQNAQQQQQQPQPSLPVVVESESRASEGLGLEYYKRLVTDVERKKVNFLKPKSRLKFSPSDLTVITQEDNKDRADPSLVVHRKVEHVSKIALYSTPTPGIRRVPLYKELYEESARNHDSKLSSLELELKLTESRVAGFRLVADVVHKKKAKEADEFFTPLSEGEEDKVYFAMHGGRSNELLVTHEPSNIEITREILQCLNPGAWLNDEVINLYLELLKEREKREPKSFLRCHFFNTFFYKKLISGRSGYDFKAVRRWTTQKKLGYSLIECEKVFVPIHKEVHWCLAVIDVKNQKLQYLDSLGGMDVAVLEKLARYFMDEVKDKSNKQIDTSSWEQESISGLPLQKNGWDCGMFMLKYMDFYSRGLGLRFGQEHMPYFRKRTAKEILSLRAD